MNVVALGDTESGTLTRAIKRENVRAGQGTSHANVSVLDIGERTPVLERTEEWFRLPPTSDQTERFIDGPFFCKTVPPGSLSEPRPDSKSSLRDRSYVHIPVSMASESSVRGREESSAFHRSIHRANRCTVMRRL